MGNGYIGRLVVGRRSQPYPVCIVARSIVRVVVPGNSHRATMIVRGVVSGLRLRKLWEVEQMDGPGTMLSALDGLTLAYIDQVKDGGG